MALHSSSKHRLAAPAAVFAVALLFLTVWLPGRLYGDAFTLVALLSGTEYGAGNYHHAGYIPLVRGLDAVLAWFGTAPSPATVLQLLSALGASFGLACCYTIARQLGASTSASFVTCGAFLLAPALNFFGRAAEVHTPHFAASALLLAVLLGLRSRPKWWTPAAIVVLAPALFLTHQGGLLLYPGVALIGLGLMRQRGARGWRPILIAGLATGVSLAIALALSAWLRDIPIRAIFESSSNMIEEDIQEHRLFALIGGLLLPMGFAWAAIVWGMRRAWSANRGLFLAVLAYGLPAAIFFSWWGVPERGAYTMGYLPLLAAVAAIAVERLLKLPRGKLIVTTALALQATLSTWMLHDFATGGALDFQQQRIAQIKEAFRDIEGPKVLITVDPTFQSPAGQIRGLVEVHLVNHAVLAVNSRRDPEAWAKEVGRFLLGAPLAQVDTAIFDRSYTQHARERPDYVPYMAAMEAEIRALFGADLAADAHLWILKRPPGK